MITIVSGTNRPNSNTKKVALQYQILLQQKGVEANILSLENLLPQRSEDFIAKENELLIPAHQFIFILPEYNGSFPGILKLMFDITKPADVWHNKKALLTGVASGRAGNLRGMDHLSDVLNHLKITVHPNKLPISTIDKLLNEAGEFNNEQTLTAVQHQLNDFLAWI
jgi:chromate reductase, NAD(P)H dehydrogenase (quinone)